MINLISKCICCNREKFSKIKKTSYLNLPVHQCNYCGLGISGSDEIEMKNKTEAIYNEKYWDEIESESEIKASYSNSRSIELKRRWTSQKKYCEPYILTKKNILEIGAGGGQSLFWFQEQGFTVLGLEPDKRNVDLINQKMKNENKCLKGFAESFSTKKKFDLIWMSHVLEHTIRPDQLFSKIYSMLNKEGILFIEVPNCENKTILSRSIDDNPSTYHFTKTAILELGKNSNFQILKIDFLFRKRSFVEKIERGFEKYLHFKIKDHPFHFEITSDAQKGIDLRFLFIKK